jgi:hypothetical protein
MSNPAPILPFRESLTFDALLDGLDPTAASMEASSRTLYKVASAASGLFADARVWAI